MLSSRGAKNPNFQWYALWIGIGLLFGSAGDVFMELEVRHAKHVSFGILFAPQPRVSPCCGSTTTRRIFCRA